MAVGEACGELPAELRRGFAITGAAVHLRRAVPASLISKSSRESWLDVVRCDVSRRNRKRALFAACGGKRRRQSFLRENARESRSIRGDSAVQLGELYGGGFGLGDWSR